MSNNGRYRHLKMLNKIINVGKVCSHLRGYSDEPQTLLFRDDRIDMELAMFKAEARGMKGIIELDPVRWWIRNSSKMPLMSKLAMIYLLPPASTADVEIAR